MKSTFLENFALYEHSGYDSKLGMGHDDICVAFMMICSQRFLNERGQISFLLKQSIYQGEAHGLFRSLQVQRGEKVTEFCLKSVLDLSSGNPFQSSGAATSVAVIQKNESTKFPIQYRKYDLRSIEPTMKVYLLKNLRVNANLLIMKWVLNQKGAKESMDYTHKGAALKRSERTHQYVTERFTMCFLLISRVPWQVISLSIRLIPRKKSTECQLHRWTKWIYPAWRRDIFVREDSWPSADNRSTG